MSPLFFCSVDDYKNIPGYSDYFQPITNIADFYPEGTVSFAFAFTLSLLSVFKSVDDMRSFADVEKNPSLSSRISHWSLSDRSDHPSAAMQIQFCLNNIDDKYKSSLVKKLNTQRTYGVEWTSNKRPPNDIGTLAAGYFTHLEGKKMEFSSNSGHYGPRFRLVEAQKAFRTLMGDIPYDFQLYTPPEATKSFKLESIQMIVNKDYKGMNFYGFRSYMNDKEKSGSITTEEGMKICESDFEGENQRLCLLGLQSDDFHGLDNPKWPEVVQKFCDKSRPVDPTLCDLDV